MKMNRIQFQKGISLNQFLDDYGTEDKCEAVLEQNRWPDGFRCPTCSNAEHFRYRRGKVLVFQCKTCRKQVTLTEGTIFHSSKLPLTTWFQAMFLLTQNKNNIATLELRRLIGVSYPAAWRVKHKLMQVMVERERSTKLSGRVEVDDAYLGGEHPGGKAGRGSENKVPFIAAVQTNDQNHPIYAVFSRVNTFSSEEVATWAHRSLSSTAKVVTDGLWCFGAVTSTGCEHQREVVGKGNKSTDMECFTWVNTVIGNLKTAISGTYHSFAFGKYASRYLGEYQYRFNRRFDLAAMLPRLIRAAARTGARTGAWLKLAEDSF